MNPKRAQSIKEKKVREHQVQPCFMLMKPRENFDQNLELMILRPRQLNISSSKVKDKQPNKNKLQRVSRENIRGERIKTRFK